MLRSLYSGISGMKVNQTKLDVIGNNIANVGTTAFKGGRVRFQDMLSQTSTSALAPSANQGGVNPKQIGLGVQIAGIDTMVQQGMMQPTSRTLDVAMDGEGYIMVGKGPTIFDTASAVNVGNNANNDKNHTVTNSQGMETMFTRDGALTLDNQGNLLTSDGYRVLGYSLVDPMATGVESIQSVATPGVPGATAVQGVYSVTLGTSDVVIDGKPFTYSAIVGTADKWNNATELKALVGTDALLGTNYTTAVNGAKLDFTQKIGKETATALTVTGTGNSATITTAGISATAIAAEVSGDINFVDANSKLTTAGISATANVDKVLKTLRIPDQVFDNITGKFIRIKTFSIEKDGVIKAVLDDGRVTAIGQIAVASFKNPAGLTKLGKNLYQQSSNAGLAVVRSGIGEVKANDNSKGYGEMNQGMLEMSNVDLAEQFTDMIIASRAFQASSKVISTGDEILQDILALKR